MLADRGVTIELDDSAKELLVKEGYDPVYGARPLKRVIQRDLLNPLSLDILEGKFREGQTVKVHEKNGKLEFSSDRA